MRAYIKTSLLTLIYLVLVSCQTGVAGELFFRAEAAYKRSGPLAAVAICLPQAKSGNPEAAFYVGTFYIAEAAIQRKRGITGLPVTKLEDSALHWYSIARKLGNEEARVVLDAVKRHGRRILYISTAHMIGDASGAERDFGRYRWPKKAPRER